jgi:predicted dehydrogenase
MNAIKIGVIGAGNMGKNHIRLISEIPSFDFVGIYDTKPEAAEVAKNYDVCFFSEVDELLSRVEAVVIASPSSTHLDMAVKAAGEGLHALVEKPLGLNSKEARLICDAFDKSGTVLAVGHVERFNPVVLEVEKMIGHEEVIAINTRRFSPKNPRISDADVLQDLLIHDLDIVMNALNKSGIRQLYANGRTSFSKSHVDYTHSIIEFENGVLATLEASRTTEDKIREIDIHSANSFIRMDLLNKTLTITRSTNFKLDTGYNSTYRQDNITEKVFIQMVEPLRSELLDFYSSISGAGSPRISGEDALSVLKVVDDMSKQIYKES